MTLEDAQGERTVWDDREIRVQVQGAAQLAGMDNGNLADVTPFSSEIRKTAAGKMAVYVRRTGPGGIQVFLEMTGSKSPSDKSPSYGTVVSL